MSKKESNTSPLDLGSIIAAQTTPKQEKTEVLAQEAVQATKTPQDEKMNVSDENNTTEINSKLAVDEENVENSTPSTKPADTTAWGRFLSIAQELRDKEKERKASGKKAEGDEKGIQVLIDADVKYTLDELKSKGIHIPTKHLLTAAVKVFLESNSKEVNKILGKRRKI
jgi:hypothetical protein